MKPVSPAHPPQRPYPTSHDAHAVAGNKSLADLLTLLGGHGPPTPEIREAAARVALGHRRVTAGQPLVEMGMPAMAMYFVDTGTFKIARSDRDGYEQVLAFAGRGEALGYDALCADQHPTSAIALEDSTVYVIPKSSLALIRRSVPAFELELQRAACVALARSNDLVDIMAAVSSEVRLARFLLQLSRQMSTKGLSPRRFLLRMGRRDIASMLGVALATVSRSFSALAAARLLYVNDRDVEILDIDALREYARCTRKAMEESVASGACRLDAPLRADHGAHSVAGLQA
ncbi:Crp/Fnr family transcriptional regulator [Hydrogenophaga borbori]